METKNREKILLVATGAVAGLWLLNLLVISPLIDSWHDRSAEIAKLKDNIAKGAALIRRDSVIRDRWDTMRANALANNPTVAQRQLFTAFGHWVNSAGVNAGSFNPQVQESDSNYTTVDCRSDVSGTLESLRDFLHAMNKDPLANKVDSFEVASKDDNGRQLVLGLSLSGLVLTDSDPSSISLPPKPADAAPAMDANSDGTTNSDPFHEIALNNIFDQSRVYRDGAQRYVPVVIHTVKRLMSCGMGSDAAFFEGDGVDSSKFYHIGDDVGDFKLARIGLSTVTLTNSSSNTFVLPNDHSASLRREDNGPWQISGYAEIASAPATTTIETGAGSAATASKLSNVEEMLKKRREEAEK